MSHSTAAVFDTATFTPEKRVDLAEVPANRPAWLSTPCPAWCVEEHRDSDHPVDRVHRSGTLSTPLMGMPFVAYGPTGGPREYAPLALLCDLAQGWREAEPMVNIADTGDRFNVELSLNEAERFARGLLALVESARRAGAGVAGHR